MYHKNIFPRSSDIDQCVVQGAKVWKYKLGDKFDPKKKVGWSSFQYFHHLTISAHA